MRRFKKFIMPAAALIVSCYISFLFALGIIIGYLSTHFCHKKITERRKLRNIHIPFFKWKLHFHHWLMGIMGMFLLWIVGVLDFFPVICWGMAGGLIFHDFYSDKDWYKIIVKR